MSFKVVVRRTHIPFEKKFRKADPGLFLEKNFDCIFDAYDYFVRGWSRDLMMEGFLGRYEIKLFEMGKNNLILDSNKFSIGNCEMRLRWLEV